MSIVAFILLWVIPTAAFANYGIEHYDKHWPGFAAAGWFALGMAVLALTLTAETSS